MVQINRRARPGRRISDALDRRRSPRDARDRAAREGNGQAADGRSIDKYRHVLLLLRARLRGDVDQMAESALSAATEAPTSPMDIADAAADTLHQELTLSFLGSQAETLQRIDRALRRLEDGSYGLCDDCRRPIAPARLGAIPYTEICVACALRRERSGS